MESEADLRKLGITALKEIAKREGITGYSFFRSATKDLLADKILAEQAKRTPTPAPATRMKSQPYFTAKERAERARTIPVEDLPYPELYELSRKIKTWINDHHHIGGRSDMIANIIYDRWRRDSNPSFLKYLNNPRFFRKVYETPTEPTYFPIVRELEDLTLSELQEIASDEKISTQGTREELIKNIINNRKNPPPPPSRVLPPRKSPQESDFNRFPLEIVEKIGQNLSDRQIINLYRSDPSLYLTLNDWYSIADLEELNNLLGPETPITSKFRIRKIKLIPNEKLPEEFKSLRVETKRIGDEYFIEMLFSTIAKSVEVKSVVVNGRTYRVKRSEYLLDEVFEPINPPANAKYNYRLVNVEKNFQHSMELIKVDTSSINDHDLEKINQTLMKIFTHPELFDNDLSWVIENIAGWNEDGRGSNLEYGIQVELPFWEEARIKAHSTLDDVINAFLNLKSHKFENNYELFIGAEIEIDDDEIKISLDFDHGS